MELKEIKSLMKTGTFLKCSEKKNPTEDSDILVDLGDDSLTTKTRDGVYSTVEITDLDYRHKFCRGNILTVSVKNGETLWFMHVKSN